MDNIDLRKVRILILSTLILCGISHPLTGQNIALNKIYSPANLDLLETEQNLLFQTLLDYTKREIETDEDFLNGIQAMAKKPLTEVNSLPAPSDNQITAIIGAHLIDGLGGPPVDHSTVIVKGNKIVAAGSRDSLVVPEDADRYNAEGKTLLPGLIDAHFHSTMSNKLVNRFLNNGVTTLRDPGHPFRFYQSLYFAEIPVPRVFLTGAHLDGFPPVWPKQAVVIKNKKHARQTVIDHVKNGGTGIKIYFNLPLKYYETITETAKEQGVPVMAHLELVDADDAIRAGVTGIEHVTSFGTALADPKDSQRFKKAVKNDYSARFEGRYKLWASIDLDADRVREVIDLAAKKDVIISPTLALYERRKLDDEVEDFQVKGYENMVRFIKMAHRAGIKIVTGSHMSVRYADFGWAYQREMEVLVQAGLSPMDVIQSSTIGNAQYFRTEQRLGSIEAGKLADLLVVDGNPIENMEAMYNIERVMLNGKWVQDP